MRRANKVKIAPNLVSAARSKVPTGNMNEATRSEESASQKTDNDETPLLIKKAGPGPSFSRYNSKNKIQPSNPSHTGRTFSSASESEDEEATKSPAKKDNVDTTSTLKGKTLKKKSDEETPLSIKKAILKRNLASVDRSKMTMRDLIYTNPADGQRPSNHSEKLNMRQKPFEVKELPKKRQADMVNYGSWRKRRRSGKWSQTETARFFIALQMLGTVFSLMEKHFPGRTRDDLKKKFKKEEKDDPTFVDKMLSQRRPYDPTQFMDSGKTSPEVEDDVKTAPVEKKTPETVETNGNVIDTVVAKGKKGKGKKPGKKEVVEENHLNRVEAAAPAPVAETKEKRGRGKKAQPPVAKSEEMSSSPEVNPEPVEETAQEKDVQVWVFKVVAEPKSKPGPKSKTGPKSKMETKPTEAESETTQVVEPEVVEKKGRGKRGNQVLDTAPPTVTEVVTDQPEVQAPPVVAAATEVSPPPEVKKGRGKVKATVEEVQEPKESENLVTNEPDTKEKRGRGRQASSKDGTEKAAKASEEPLPNDETESPLPASPVAETKEKRGRGPQAKAQAEAPVEETTEAVEVVPAKRGRGNKAAAPAASKADAEEEAVEEVKETKPKGKKGAAAAKKHVEEEEKPAVPEEPAAHVKTVVESPETSKAVPAKKGRRKKATPLAKVAADEEAEAVEEVKETKAKGKKGPAAKKQAEEKVAAVPEAAEKPQKTTKRGKAAVATPDESEASPPKKPKGAPLETEGVRKSSRTQVVKTYADESSESLDQPASKKRGGRKKAAANAMNDAVAEEAEDNKKKPTKKKAASESPELKPEPPKVEKVAANKRGTKREQLEEAEAAIPPAAEEKKRGAKKDDKAPELPLRVVNGLEEDSETNPSKRSKTSEDAEAAAEEPEKKAGRGRKKKEEPQPVETENKSPDDGKKKCKRGGKEEVAEIEKKKPVGRKKAAAAAAVAVVQEEEPEAVASPVQTKQRGKRGAAQAADFVTVISGQNSTDPSPKGSPVMKVRRLKLVEEKQAQAESDEEEVIVPVAATKRPYTRRNK